MQTQINRLIIARLLAVGVAGLLAGCASSLPNG